MADVAVYFVTMSVITLVLFVLLAYLSKINHQ